MANLALHGFSPSRRKDEGPITQRVGRVLNNQTTAIFLYDAVVRATTGDYVVATTTTTAVASVAMGAMYLNAGTGQMVEGKYLPAATLYSGTIVDPPQASYIFMVSDPLLTQFVASVADSAIALTDLNLNYAMTLTSGSTTTGLSGHVLTATGRAATATIPWRVPEFVLGSVNSDPDLINCHVYCEINAGMDEPALTASLGA